MLLRVWKCLVVSVVVDLMYACMNNLCMNSKLQNTIHIHTNTNIKIQNTNQLKQTPNK